MIRRSRLWFDLSLLVILGAAVFGSTLALARRTDYSFVDAVVDIKHLVEQKFVREVDETKLQEGAIKGMLEALNDPYSEYVPPADAMDFNKNLTGEYVGIGAQVFIQDDYLTIQTPLEDSPAFREGLMPDDRVLEIDGKSTHKLTVQKCVDLLVGEPGTPVKLTIDRQGEKLEVTIVRERIKTRSVKGFHRQDQDGNKWMYTIDPDQGIAYIRLTQFTPGCARELAEALLSIDADKGNVKGLVLDLRFNPGGVLGEAIAIADLFLKDGTIVSTRGRAHKEEKATARDPGTLPDFPIAILLNGQSASASEVLSGALVENNRAIAVGSRSFGKGSVQTVHTLAKGELGELKLTEQGYYLPSGRSLTRTDDSETWGVDPSPGFYIPMSDEEVGDMLDVRRKLEVLRQGGGEDDGQWTNADWVLSTLHDKQLSAAVNAVRGKIATGEWKGSGESEHQTQKIAMAELQDAVRLQERLERELERTAKRISALETAAGDSIEPQDLLPDDADLAGGVVEVKDKDGHVIAILDIKGKKITGRTLERWLQASDLVTKEGAPDSTAAKPSGDSSTPGEKEAPAP